MRSLCSFTRRREVTEGTFVPSVRLPQRPRKAVEHAGGGAPDVAAFVGNRHVMPVTPAEAIFAAYVARWIEEMLERRFEHRRHFERIGLDIERRLYPRDD